MHGFMANMTLEPLKSLAKELERRGIASLRFDFDGHGRSYGKFSEMTPLRGTLMGRRYDPANPPKTLSVLLHKVGRDYLTQAQTLPIYETSACYQGPVCHRSLSDISN